jgi:hypothetical protein
MHFILTHLLSWMGHWSFPVIACVAIIGGYIALASALPALAARWRGEFIVALIAIGLFWLGQNLGHKTGVDQQMKADQELISKANEAKGKAESDKAFADAQVKRVEESSLRATAALDALKRQRIIEQAAAEKRYAEMQGKLGPECAPASDHLGAFLERETK